MADYTIHVPKGYPDQIRVAATNLKSIAGDLDDNATSVHGEAKGMAEAWTDHNGKAAHKEAIHLADGGGKYAGHVNEGANALRSFAHALDTAQDDIKKCRSDKEAVFSDAWTAARNDTSGFDLMSHTDQAALVEGYAAHGMGPIMARYKEARDTLQKAEKRCKEHLTDAIPGYKDGMSAKKVAAMVLEDNLEQLPGAMRAYGAELAKKAEKYVDDNKKIPEHLLHTIEKYRTDENFAAGFMPEFGSRKRLNLLAAEAIQGKDSKYYHQIIGDLGTMLAAGTDKHTLPKKYVHSLTEPLDKHDDIGGQWAWTLTQYIGATNHRFGTKFLDDVSEKMWRFQTDKHADYRLSDAFNGKSAIDKQYAADPFGSLFHAMGHNADAAQDFFSDTKKIDYFADDANDNAWNSADNGVELGKALKAATITYLNGHKGKESAEIMKHLIGNFADHKGADWLDDHRLGGIRKSLTGMLVTYAHSINDTFYPRDSTGQYLGKHVDPTVMKAFLGTSEWTAIFDQDGLMNAMRDVSVDKDTYTKLSNAVMKDAKDVLVRDLYDSSSWDNAQDALGECLSRMGKGLGGVVGARQGALLANAQHSDKASKILGDMVSEALKFVPDKPSPTTKGGVEIAYEYLVRDQIFPTTHEHDAIVAGYDQRDSIGDAESKKIDLNQFHDFLTRLRGKTSPEDSLGSDIDQMTDTFDSAFHSQADHNWYKS